MSPFEADLRRPQALRTHFRAADLRFRRSLVSVDGLRCLFSPHTALSNEDVKRHRGNQSERQSEHSRLETRKVKGDSFAAGLEMCVFC